MKRPTILSLLLSILFIAAGIGGYVALQDHFNGYAVMATSSLGKIDNRAPTKDPDEPKDLKTIIHESQKSVVQLEVTTSTGESVGSGFLYNDKGDIVTNAHVVKGAEKIIARTADAKQYEGYLIGIGDKTDVAVVRVPKLAGQMPLPVEHETKAEIGDKVIALGSPIGLQNTVTTGIISGVDRQFTIDEFTYLGVYQISAPIAKGNSGGPLVDQTTGKVLAINSAGTDEGAIGFSIPITNVYDKIIGWSEHPEDVPPEMMTDSGDGSTDNEPSKLYPGDGEYIVGYFYESLSIGDYVTAYSLLGSNWQTKIPYEKFREGYIHTVDVTIDQISSTHSEDDEEATVTVIINALEREEEQETKSVLYKCTYHVEFENNQLKITSGSAVELK